MSFIQFAGVQPSFFNRYFENDQQGRTSRANTQIPVNIIENEDSFRIELLSPGANREAFSISLDKNNLTVSMEKQKEEATTNEKYYRRDFSSTSFSRSFTLPDHVQLNEISARYDNGILFVNIPKSKDENPAGKRSIAIG